jgi:two-component system sensor histidine kinase CpxA
VLLLLLGLAFAQFQFHVRFNSLLTGPARERVVSAARQLALDLEDTPAGSRDELLRRYSRTYGVAFYLIGEPGARLLAGPNTAIPDAVIEEMHKPPPRAARPPPPRRDEPRPPPADDQTGGPPDRHPPLGPEQQPPLFEISTTNPSQYWVGSGIPVREPGNNFAIPGFVLMASPSFFGTPLFFDYKPWLAVGGSMLLAVVLCWWPFIRGTTHAVTEMSRVTEQIAEGRFDHHLPEDRRDELGLLAGGINRMAARLSGFVSGQKRFLGDIAHELCAPIARIQFALGILEQRSAPGTVDDLQEEVRQMSSLVGELLSFSKTGMEQARRQMVSVGVLEVAKQAIAQEGVAADLRIDAGIMASADPEYLLRSLANLIRNSHRYAGDAGPVTIGARRDRNEIVIAVSDNGPGLPEDEVDRVFTPFYRVETSRSRTSGGAGLGLAIVRSCVEACNGTVRCRNRRPSGLEVEIRLPAAG